MTPKQSSFEFRKHGGPRPGSGRKPKHGKPMVSHLARPKFDGPTPAHVTLRVVDDVPSLRSSRRFARIRSCFAASRGRFGVRLVEFTVLGNHLHLIVEADGNEALSRGMQGLAVRLAKALNAALIRSGSLFADHYHSRLLRTPTELARAIRYVVENAAHHYGERDYSFTSRAPKAIEVLVRPVGWLLIVGWKKAKSHDAMMPAGLFAEPCLDDA